MHIYEHDTYYYGGEILNTINSILGKPLMDRGGKYVWVVNDGVVYCDLLENNNIGILEFHRNGHYVIGMHILTLCNDDLRFYSDTIDRFLRSF